MLITDRNRRFCGFPRGSFVRIGSQRIITDFTGFAVTRRAIRAYVGLTAQRHATIDIRSGFPSDSDRVFRIGYRLISDSRSVFHGRIGATADRRTAISHLFLPDITYIGSSAQCDRVFAVRSGFPSDSDAIIHRCRIIFIAGFRSATDGNRVTAVRLRRLDIVVRLIVVTADGNRTNPFGTCLIAEGDGSFRRRFRIHTHGDRVIFRFAAQPDSNRPFACFNAAAHRHRLHAGFGTVTDDSGVFVNFTMTADDNAVRVVGVGLTTDGDNIGTAATG